MAMKTKRHAKILEIIHQKSVETQEDLLLLLREDGYNVTQATVSRDIKELRLIKALGPDGRYRYSTVRLENENISSKFHSLFADTVLHIRLRGQSRGGQVPVRYGAGGLRGDGFHALGSGGRHIGGRGHLHLHHQE